MTKITIDDVLKLANLARLELSEEEVKKFQTEIQAILTYVEQLQSCATAGLEPTYQVTGLSDITRSDDDIDYGTEPSKLLSNAPDRQDNYFKVKRMVG